MSYEDQEYHRRRSEIELESAVSASDRHSAVRHLELARLHRARRQLIAATNLRNSTKRNGSRVLTTDKEA